MCVCGPIVTVECDRVLCVLAHLLSVGAQLGESVDDQAEDHREQDRDHEHVKRELVQHNAGSVVTGLAY